MPPEMDRAEAAFDAVQDLLDERNIASWKPREMEVFLSLLGTHYADLRAQSMLRRSRGRRSLVTAGEGRDHPEDSHHSDDSGKREAGDDEEELDGEELATIQREAAVAEVDRGLARLRAFLQKQLPFTSHHEPTKVADTKEADATDAERVNAQRGQQQPHPAKNQRQRTKTESVPSSTSEHHAGVVPPVVYPIDAFLYLEEDVEDLCDGGLVSRYYCTSCGSTSVAPTEFITHSFSQDQLVYLSCFLLPALAEEGPAVSARRVVDVGSRLGVVLWACCLAAQNGIMQRTESVTGVEVDTTLATLQKTVGTRFFPRPIPLACESDVGCSGEGGDERNTGCRALQWSVVESDCFTGHGAKSLASADVVVLHNVFEYFCLTAEAHLRCWLRLRELVRRKGQVLICAPSIEETLLGFSEATLEACGLLAKEEKEGADKNKNGKRAHGVKRGREKQDGVGSIGDGGGDVVDGPTRKEVAISNWIESYLEPIEDEVQELAEDFIAFRSAASDGGSEDGCGEGGSADHHAKGEHSSEENSRSHCNHVHSHDRGDGCGDGRERDEEPSELAEQIHSIRVYKVK